MHYRSKILCLLFCLGFALATESNESENLSLLIDDFSKPNPISVLETEWNCFTDRVMGGVSNASHSFEEEDGKHYIRLRGDVSLENNGGFVQTALPLTQNGVLDASEYEGIRLTVRGNGERYQIHLKNSQTRLPWQYFYAPFQTSENWKTLELPFSKFEPDRLNAKLDPSTLKRVAIVAIGREFEADVSVSHIEFYKKSDK